MDSAFTCITSVSSVEGSGESAQTSQNIRCLHTQGMKVEEGSDLNLDL